MMTALPAPTGPGLARLLAGPESNKAGPLGLLTIVLLCIAVYFLYRSMVRHMKKVPESFEEEPPADRQRPDRHPAGDPAARGPAIEPRAGPVRPPAGSGGDAEGAHQPGEPDHA